MENVQLADEQPPAPPQSEPQIPSWRRHLVVYLARQFLHLKLLMHGNLRIQNLRAVLLTGTVPDNGTIILTHNLNKLPEIFIPNLEEQGSIWVSPTDRSSWTTTSIQLSSDRPGALFTLLVL